MAIENRYDFALMFDVKDGNPNGDPDAGNLPRIDPETGHGLVTDVCLKRKIRNYVLLSKHGAEGYDIFIKEKAILNLLIADAYKGIGIDLDGDATTGKKRKTKGSAQDAEIDAGKMEMCRRYFDVRAFGAVMSTGANAGQVRGPAQLTFGRSVDAIVPQEHSITRMAVATEKEAEAQSGDNRTMGRKASVPYGLYVAHGFVSPAFAAQTGFSEDDLKLLWEALVNMFDHDRSAARGLMATRKLVVFKHESSLGNARAHELFERVTVKSTVSPARSFSDYEIAIDRNNLPQGVDIVEMV